MTTHGAEGTENAARRAWSLGVGARLLLAFFGITAFAVLAAAAGIYAFREVGGRLEVIDTRLPSTLSAIDLSRSAERIIAAAPSLLATSDRFRRDKVKAQLAAEVELLNRELLELKRTETRALPLDEIEQAVSLLNANLVKLEDVVARRLDVSERIRTRRSSLFKTHDETQQLLAPWLAVLDSQVAALAKGPQPDPTGARNEPGQLAMLIELQRLVRAAQAQVSAIADLLAEAATTDEPQRLSILAFQLGLALLDLQTTADGLDPKLRSLFLEQVTRLREFAAGPNALTEARKQELALVGEGEKLLSEASTLSAQLTAAVDQLGRTAKQDIGEAISDTLSMQRLSTRGLVVVVALSLLTSVLIVWLYVGGNIVRRLTALSDGMRSIAGGRLQAPLMVEGGDEIGAMGRAVEIFRQNTLERDGLLAEKAQTADRLEKEVKQRTAELELANAFKLRFLAAASHDLRQPLHALNLFVAQLRASTNPIDRRRLIGRIEAAVGSMNELFEALLDMSKLEAGILEPDLTEFSVNRLLGRVETTFADAAREKGLRLAVVPSSACVRSDFVLLERILFNLVSNAVRYTARGGVLVGARRKGGQLRIDVHDTGPGIPKDQRQNVFREFHQLAGSDRRSGLGLGLAIVERLGRLLDHGIDVESHVSKGSRFSVTVPLVAIQSESIEAPIPLAGIADPADSKLVIVIDDDALVLDGMARFLHDWGCAVLTADSGGAALAKLAAQRLRPDLIVSDYRLADGKTGIEAIERIRAEVGAEIPAFLISGDTVPKRLREADASGYHLLHKPVAPIRLRAILNQLLKAHDTTGARIPSIRSLPTGKPAGRDPVPRQQ